jgi:dipeptide/tripeptide permease
MDRPDLTAKFHLAEAPIYFLMLWLMLPRLGISGVAIAWTARVTIDNVALFIAAGWLLPDILPQIAQVALIGMGAIAAIGVCVIPTDLTVRTAFVVAILCLFGLLAMRLIGRGERSTLLRYISSSVAFGMR